MIRAATSCSAALMVSAFCLTSAETVPEKAPLEGVVLSGDLDFDTMEHCMKVADAIAKAEGLVGGFMDCTKYELVRDGEEGQVRPEEGDRDPSTRDPGPQSPIIDGERSL